MNATPENTVSTVTGSRGRTVRAIADRRRERAGQDEQDAGGGVGGARAERVEQPAERGPDDLRGLPGGDDPGHRAGRSAAGATTSRHQRASWPGSRTPGRRRAGRPARRCSCASASRRRRRGRARPPAAAFTTSHSDDDQAAIVAVRDLPDHQGQQDHRHELREADQPQVERAAGQLVELPADRDAQHLEADAGQDPRRGEQANGGCRRSDRAMPPDGAVGPAPVNR